MASFIDTYLSYRLSQRDLPISADVEWSMTDNGCQVHYFGTFTHRQMRKAYDRLINGVYDVAPRRPDGVPELTRDLRRAIDKDGYVSSIKDFEEPADPMYVTAQSSAKMSITEDRALYYLADLIKLEAKDFLQQLGMEVLEIHATGLADKAYTDDVEMMKYVQAVADEFDNKPIEVNVL